MNEEEKLKKIKEQLLILLKDAQDNYNNYEPGYAQATAKGRISGLNSGLFWIDYYLTSD